MIEYIIENNKGNILLDIINTLNTFSKQEIDTIINDIYNGKKIFFLYKEDYDFISKSSDTDKSFIDKKRYQLDLRKILYEIASYNDNKYLNLINNFNNKKIYALFVGKDKLDIRFINLCFEILSDEDKYNKFLDFENNKNIFSFNDSYNKEHYILEMIKYFDKKKKIVMIKNIQFNFDFITNEMKERYYRLKKLITVSDKTKNEQVEITANDGYVYSYHKQKYIDNDWKLDKSIEDFVFCDIDSNYSIEETIAHIYIKLCILLEFEGAYMKDTNINNLYSKEIMESINVDNPNILCSDFSHIFTKIINKLENIDSRSVRCGTGERVHEYTTLLIKDKDIKINFDPIDVKEGLNDLTSAKLGEELTGIDYVKDEKNIFKNAFNKVYKNLKNKQAITTYNLINQYEKKYLTNIPINYDDNFNSFLKEMKNKNIRGSELIIAFMRMQNIGYFGNINYSLAFIRFDNGYMERLIIFENNDRTYYFRTSTQEIIEISKKQLNDLFDNNILTYEDDKYTLEGVGLLNDRKTKGIS